MALLFLGFWFVTLHDAPECDSATLDTLTTHITLGERPKTLLGLAVTACVERWLRRHLWMVGFESLSPSDQAVRVVTDSAMRIDCAWRCRPSAGADLSCHSRRGWSESARDPPVSGFKKV
jgi:hypothetical protein